MKMNNKKSNKIQVKVRGKLDQNLKKKKKDHHKELIKGTTLVYKVMDREACRVAIHGVTQSRT